MQIVVLGMHRSGTSALCGLLNLAGVYFGCEDELIPADQENPKGFCERLDVRCLNDKILHRLGCDWSEISQLDQHKLGVEIRDTFQAEAKTILRKLQGNSPVGVTGLKEPRFCLLMDFWSSVLSSERFFILLHRDVEEIAISLKNRNGIPGEVANYLTEHYLGDAISAMQMEPCHIASFARLISDPVSELDSIIKSVSKVTGVRLDKPTRKEVERFITPSLYRSRSKGEFFSISDQLRSWNESLSLGDLPELNSFQQIVPASVLPYEHARRFSEFKNLSGRFRRLEEDYFAIKQKLAQQHDLERLVRQRDGQVADLEQIVSQRETQVAELEQIVSQRETQVAELEQIVSQSDVRLRKLQSELNSSKATLLEMSKLKNHLLERLNALQGTVTAQLVRPLYRFEQKFPKILRGIVMLPKLLWWALTFRLRKNWRLYRQANRLLADKSFDLSWYIQHNPDVVLAGVDPVWHWLTLGWQENRDPNPMFSNSWYLEQYPDVADTGENPLLHYLSHGASEGRDPHPLFNSDWYLAQNPNVVDAGINPLLHYLSNGASEGRKIMPSGNKREPVRRLKAFDADLESKTRMALRARYNASDKAGTRLVSIIMPTYNRAGLITAAINSVVGQTHKNWELLIVDDGSDDETETVVNEFAGDRRIKYLRKERGGVCLARNAGLDQAQGERIAFLDSDNAWDREFLALLVTAIETSDVEIAYCGLRMQQRGGTVGYRGDVFNYAECLKSNYVDLNALMFQRSVIGDIRFDESIRRMNDWDFLLSVAVNRRVEYFPFIGVSYSFHERADQISELEPQIYKKIIQERHKNHQANQALMTTRDAFARVHLEVAILLAAPKEKRNEWGDYHYATGLARALTRRGHKPRLYYHQEQVEGAPPDITISLRGLTAHEFMVGTIKVIWSISHPDLLTWQQIDDCDLLFCASLTWPQMLQWAGKFNAFPLLQCTDHERFFPQPNVSKSDDRVLFVGNSRKADRPIVRHAVDADVNLHIYGTNWQERVPGTLLKGEYIPNEQLTSKYAAAAVVLNDHWPSMKDFGFISNRIFDVTAAGGVLVSDYVPGINRVFGDAVSTFRSAEDFSGVLKQSMALSAHVDRIELGNWVNENHTFQNRADDILDQVETFALTRIGGEVRTADSRQTMALRGDIRCLRVGIVPQVSGVAMTSSAYIRLVQPLTSELDDVAIDLVRVEQNEPLQDLDAVIVSRTAFDSLAQAEAFLEQSGKLGIPVVVDTDDSFHLMDESHPQFAEYQPKVDALSLILESADEIWCSTVPLQQSLKTRFGESVLFPNSLDPCLWRTYRDFPNPPQRDEDDCFEILYAGSLTHGSDLDMVMPVLDQLAGQMSIRLTVIGIAPDIPSRPWVRRLNPGINSIYPRFAPWLLRHAPLFDVGIAPLTDNPFNRFKSDLKILEYRAMGLVSVASTSQPYIDSTAIDDQYLCADASAWMERLLSLASDRGQLEQLKQWVTDSSPYIWEDRSAISTGNQMVDRLGKLVY